MFVANIVSISRRDALHSHMQKRARREKLNGSITARHECIIEPSGARWWRGVANYFIEKDKKSGRERLIGALARDTLFHQAGCVFIFENCRESARSVPARALFAIQMSGGTCR